MSNLSPTQTPSPAALSTVVLDGVSRRAPGHNEEENLAEAVHEAIAAAEQVSRRQEIVVVDYGSRDGRVRLDRHETNRGYASAIRTANCSRSASRDRP
jgi:hypothetical protein